MFFCISFLSYCHTGKLNNRTVNDFSQIYVSYIADILPIVQSLTRHFFISFSIVHTNKICLIHIYSGIQSKLKCTIVWIHKSSPALFFFIFPSWNQIPMCTYLSFETLLFYFSHPFSLPIHPAL